MSAATLLLMAACQQQRRRASYPAILNDGNTMAWYDFMKGVTKDESNYVSQWNDNLLSGRDLYQANEDKRPIWQSDGVLFDGSNDILRSSAWTHNQPSFIYTVINQVTAAASRILFDGLANYNALQHFDGGLRLYAGAALGKIFPTLNTYNIIRALFNGTSSKLILNNNTPVTGNAGTVNPSGFSLGGQHNDGINRWSNIKVKEIIIRKVADTSENETTIYEYLKNKHGL